MAEGTDNICQFNNVGSCKFCTHCQKKHHSDAILMPLRILKGLDHYDIVYFITVRAISNRLGLAAP